MMRPRILVLSGVRAGAEFALSAERFSIGRDPGADLSIADAIASRRHCEIVYEDDGHYIKDEGSQNGTAVNDVRITGKERLRHGDRISVGDVTLAYLSEEGRVDPAAPVVLVDGIPLDAPQTIVLERRSALLGTVLDVADALSESAEAFREQILDTIFAISPAERAAILLLGSDDTGGSQFVSKTARHRRDPARPVIVSETIARRVLKEGARIHSNDLPTSGIGPTPSLKAAAVQSIICVPLETHRRRLGLIYADSTDEDARFDRTHLELLTAIAKIAAEKMENAQLIDRLKADNARLQEELDLKHDLIGDGPAMTTLKKQIMNVAPIHSTILILGDSGTGKEVAARAIHRNSQRAAGPFVAVNCAALTESLLESELFGYEKGAFTGAATQKKGKFELADGGTLFLDEIGELPLALQPKLLRALQEKEIDRVGGTLPVKVDIRLIAATNRDLKEAVEAKEFREDLYYRLNVVPIRMPPLRDRAEDILLLARHFLSKSCREMGRMKRGFAPAVESMLTGHDWPGNVRELENLIERAVALGVEDIVLPEDLPFELGQNNPNPSPYLDAPNKMQRELFKKAMVEADGDPYQAAKILDVHPRTVNRALQR